MRRDPITNEVMETERKIRFTNGKCVDDTGKEVTLNSNGTWVYKK